MNPILFLVSSAFLVYSVRFSFLWFFKATSYVQWNRKKRNEFRRKFWFMPHNITYNFYDGHPAIEVLVSRLVGVFFVVLGILGLIVSIHGPFGPGD
jgi:hypothetical protein